MADNIPVPAASVEDAVNPDHVPPYSGPTGVVEGTVRIKGDSPPPTNFTYPASCQAAETVYRNAFRVGADGALADAMVAVTEYKGYVPAREPAVRLTEKSCAYDRRTVVAAFGQRIDVFNDDNKLAYVPYLIGERAVAHMVSVPHGDAIKLYPLRIGRFMVADEMGRPWMQADVLVVKYATHTVSGSDGHYRIEGIPIGPVKVSTFLPQANLAENSTATVEENKTAVVDFELVYKKPPPVKSAPSGSGAHPIIK